eukprot:5888368-Amphidinium_carterae.1
MHTLRALFRPDAGDVARSRRAHKVDAIRAKQPQKINAKAVFMRDLFAAARSTLPVGAKLTKDQRQQVFADVGRRFSQLTLQERLRYEAAAEHEQQEALT